MKEKSQTTLSIFAPSPHELPLPLNEATVKAGFPSPAADFPDGTLRISDYIVKHPAATFYVRVSGNSMEGDGIGDGDLLVVDKAVEVYNNCIAVCYIDGEFTIKRVKLFEDHALLIPSNPQYPTLKVTQENRFLIWGVARFLIKKL